jgi:hypothetical protein
MMNEDAGGAANPPTSSATNAPDGAMSSGPYLDAFHENPKLAVYNTQTKKKKKFATEAERDEFLRDNPEWDVNIVEGAIEEGDSTYKKSLRVSITEIGDLKQVKKQGYDIKWDYNQDVMIISDGHDTWRLRLV